MEPSAPIIRIRNLRKSFLRKAVLHGIDLDVFPGQVIGYIGPNGAGKSTTVRILAGIDSSFQGEVEIAGIDVKKDPLAVKRLIGFIPEQAELYDVLTPLEFLDLVGKLHDLDEATIRDRAVRMLGFLGLAGQEDKQMDTFSKGMKQKVLIISGLLHDPQIIFLDEPLSGLDANSVILVKEIIQRLAATGKTIFYCSHMMDVVEKVSDRIVLINQGRITADGSLEELRRGSQASLEGLFAELTSAGNNQQLADDFMDVFQKPTPEV
jgi:ABC-2 type transport system ATP-binding protein